MNWLGSAKGIGPQPALHFASFAGINPPKPGMHLKVVGRDASGIKLYGPAGDGEDFDAVLYALTDDPGRPLAMSADEFIRQQKLLNRNADAPEVQ